MDAFDAYEKYEIIRRNNEAEIQRRRNNVYIKVPELKGLHAHIRELQLERISQIAKGSAFNTRELTALRQQAKEVLIGAGFPENYLEPIYSCSICRDTGMREDARRCDCYYRYRLEYKLDEASFADNDSSFEKFDISLFPEKPLTNGISQRKIMTQYKRITETWADRFPNCTQVILISGGTGLGKTYIARCIMRRVIERGYGAAYYTAYRLFSLFHSHRLNENTDLDPIFSVPLLIIDDLGTEPLTRNVTIEYFFDLLNERAAARLHTVIVTNLKLDAIDARYGERIHSRLMYKKYSKIILFEGEDIRVQKQ